MNDTYGKVFPTMYTGSMHGAGLNVFALWPWILANKDENGVTEVNPDFVAPQLGCCAQQVQEALDYLTRPDANSRELLSNVVDEIFGGRILYFVG